MYKDSRDKGNGLPWTCNDRSTFADRAILSRSSAKPPNLPWPSQRQARIANTTRLQNWLLCPAVVMPSPRKVQQLHTHSEEHWTNPHPDAWLARASAGTGILHSWKKVVPQQMPEHTVVGPKRSTGAELAVKSDILLGDEFCELHACELAANYPSLPRSSLSRQNKLM